MKVRLEPFAWLALAEAAAGYEMRLAGRGRGFVKRVRKLCRYLSENPAMGRRVDADLRQFPLEKSPYSIVYTIAANTLVVVAIVDGRREADNWRRQSIRSVEETAAEYLSSCRAA